MSANTLFFQKLAASEEGTIILINMLDSYEGGLVNASFIRKFVQTCIKESEAHSTRDVLLVFRSVSQTISKKSTPIFLRKSKRPKSTRHGNTWTTTVDWVTWWGYHADKARMDSDHGLKIPSLSGGVTRLQLLDAERYLNDVTSNPDWSHADTGFLGRPMPYPSNCWVSTQDPDIAPFSNVPGLDVATDSRDALGLIDTKEKAVLVRYELLAASAKKVSENDFARPSFSDLGNTRWRAHGNEPESLALAVLGWGNTVHLAKLRKAKSGSVSGEAERVTRAMSIQRLKIQSIKMLGYVGDTKGRHLNDDNTAFITRLLRRRKLSTVQAQLERLCK